MPRIAQVAVELSLNREFDYLVPESLAQDIALGSLVEVPFGRQFKRGYVLAFKEESDFENLKAIHRVIGDKPLIRETAIKLVRWMSEYYMAPIEKSIQTVLPGAVRRKGCGFIRQTWIMPGPSAGDKSKTDALSVRSRAVLDFVIAAGEIPLPALITTAHTTAPTVAKLEAQGLLQRVVKTISRDPCQGREYLPSAPLSLTSEQQVALDMIRQAMDDNAPRVILLHGVTGSGKTEVYLQALDYALQKGLSAIILVPEISLTPQTVERFRARFGDQIAILHSHLSEGERHDEWHRLYDGQARIAIGARSALFAPLTRVGLIVVDEEHEPSYKQSEAPRYHARDVAVMRGHMEGCAVVLGSATPALESWQNVRNGKYRLARLTRRVDNQQMPVMHIVDMRREIQADGKFHTFSKDLLRAMNERLHGGEQTILFLNRRGYSNSLVCQVCGYVAQCPDCSIAMTYHKAGDELICHLCGKRYRPPSECPNPECRDKQFKYPGFGTQRIEELIRSFYPTARVERMDADTTTRKDAYERILGAFRAGKIDILIGTQMIAKGLHFPNVTLVGVINADVSLHLPDFRAGERCFQLLTQVAGRAGRGEIVGEVIVQTCTPAHAAIQAARRLDYDGFTDQELAFREEAAYPPFSRMALLVLRGQDESEVAAISAQLEQRLRREMDARVILSKSAPAPIARVKTFFRYQITMRAPSHGLLARPIQKALAEFRLPKNIHLSIDVDPQAVL